MKKLFRLTEEGVAELRQELASLIADRSTLADNIKTAREFGDLAENSEYQTARQAQEKNEARITELENILQSVEIIKKPKTGKDGAKVQLGSTVRLKTGDGKEKEFQVVGTVEADPLSGKISDDSPIGQALLGKKEGEEVEIKTPAGHLSYKIATIS